MCTQKYEFTMRIFQMFEILPKPTIKWLIRRANEVCESKIDQFRLFIPKHSFQMFQCICNLEFSLVWCIWNENQFLIIFPLPQYLHGHQFGYANPQSIRMKNSKIQKLSMCSWHLWDFRKCKYFMHLSVGFGRCCCCCFGTNHNFIFIAIESDASNLIYQSLASDECIICNALHMTFRCCV